MLELQVCRCIGHTWSTCHHYQFRAQEHQCVSVQKNAATIMNVCSTDYHPCAWLIDICSKDKPTVIWVVNTCSSKETGTWVTNILVSGLGIYIETTGVTVYAMWTYVHLAGIMLHDL